MYVRSLSPLQPYFCPDVSDRVAQGLRLPAYGATPGGGPSCQGRLLKGALPPVQTGTASVPSVPIFALRTGSRSLWDPINNDGSMSIYDPYSIVSSLDVTAPPMYVAFRAWILCCCHGAYTVSGQCSVWDYCSYSANKGGMQRSVLMPGALKP